jgi:hypothetical protein
MFLSIENDAQIHYPTRNLDSKYLSCSQIKNVNKKTYKQKERK